MLVLSISRAVFSLGLSWYINLLFLICTHQEVMRKKKVVLKLQIEKYKNKLTSSRLKGSLKAESITSLVGTIFHFGMISSKLVNILTTTGCGFNFSDIYQKNVPHKSIAINCCYKIIMHIRFRQGKKAKRPFSPLYYLTHRGNENSTIIEGGFLFMQ